MQRSESGERERVSWLRVGRGAGRVAVGAGVARSFGKDSDEARTRN